VEAEQGAGRRIHGTDIELGRMPERVVAAPRIVQGCRVGDPVLVAPPERREARVEALVGDGAAGDHDVGFQAGDAVQPAGERFGAE